MNARQRRKASDTLIGLDFGKRRIGVAVGSLVSGQAQPLGSVENSESGMNWPALERYVDEWQPGRFVVGLPRSLDGRDTLMSESARNFAARIKARFGLPVSLVDEQLSSTEAREHLREARRSGQRRKRVGRMDIDPMAAKIILETWINEQGGRDNPDFEQCN